MGMFDYIKCEYALPEVPDAIIKRWGSQADISFQTKDTHTQYMCLYKIDVEGQLWRQGMTTQRVEPKDPNAESILDRLGHTEILSTWWEKEVFTGDISFYEAYHHEEYLYNEPLGGNEWKRFEDGWVEYTATFIKGCLIEDIALVENTNPKKLTDEELATKLSEYDKVRVKYNQECSQRRKDHPTPEQRLIDEIYNYVSVFTRSVQGERNYLVEEIIGKIDCYREKYDTFYEKLN